MADASLESIVVWGEKASAELDPNLTVETSDKSIVGIIKKNTLQFESEVLQVQLNKRKKYDFN